MNSEKKHNLRKIVIIEIIAGALLTVGMLFYQQEFHFVSLMDSVVIAGILLFSLGWIVYVINVGIFDIAVYGFKQFGLAIIRKRPKLTLDQYLYEREKIDSVVYKSLFISGAIITFIGAILYVFYYFG